MLKVPIGCRTRTGKCPYYNWALGEKIDESLNPLTFQLPEPFRMRQMNPCCIKHMRELLWYLSDLFEKHKIQYWLDFGTLLGAVREGRSIPHDTDGDLCLFLQDREKVLDLRSEAKRDGFMLDFIKPAGHTDTHIKVCRSRKNYMIVDLFFWVHDDLEGVYRGDGLNVPKFFPDWWLDKFEKVSMFDKEMWAPRCPEHFLRMRFGSDWKKPQNKKVHHGEALEAHKYGFEYAIANGWQRKKMVF